MALEILDITTDNQLVAAAVSALLSKSQLEDLISCSPVLLQHAFKKLHGKLFQKVRPLTDASANCAQAVSRTSWCHVSSCEYSVAVLSKSFSLLQRHRDLSWCNHGTNRSVCIIT